MEIYCKDSWMLTNAIYIAEQLGITDIPKSVLYIKRLPPQFRQSGLIEYPHKKDDSKVHLDIYIKYDNERFITLAHEMVHVRQVLENGTIDETEAYALEKTLKTLAKAV